MNGSSQNRRGLYLWHRPILLSETQNDQRTTLLSYPSVDYKRLFTLELYLLITEVIEVFTLRKIFTLAGCSLAERTHSACA